MKNKSQFAFYYLSISLSFACFMFLQNITAQDHQANISSIQKVKNNNGPVLGYSIHSGVNIISVDGLMFKDLNKNGKLDRYEDWRLPVEVRAKDLASKMSAEQIAGLMLYSLHQGYSCQPIRIQQRHLQWKTV